MDARVNDFLNEINEIAPLGEDKDEIVWEKCFDEDSGYHYYWNIKSNEVTWDMPSEYKANSKTKTKKTSGLYIPPRTAPLFPSTSGLLPPGAEAIKIYKIGECADTKVEKIATKQEATKKEEKKRAPAKPFRRRSDSDDERIVLISSYGGDSESEEEKPQKLNGANKTSDEADDVDILEKIKKKAKDIKVIDKVIVPETKPVTGISLLAGYGDSDESDTEQSPQKNFLISPPPEENKIAHSTLFPITQPIDVKDFEENPKSPEKSEDFDSKAFQRKRRIGVALINTGKKIKIETERKGFEGSSSYPGFKSGGVMFVKTDVLNPGAVDSEDVVEKTTKIPGEIEDTYSALKEKLGFLSEGREAVSPVQAMLIQIETLYAAVKSGDLKHSYLRKWLDETCSDLIKLEKETTPEGWLLQWDRSHKRYYYQNEATGESQWEYPQADVTVCDEAMDICTTPPPNGAEPTIHMSPPLPPIIGSPSPPPPPKISDFRPTKKKNCDIPLPPESEANEEPLPPGVDAPDVSSKTKGNGSDMADALNSFYSDLAAIENSNSPPPQTASDDTKAEIAPESVQELTKKKKKSKVKLAQGIAMKKKGVSKLVEKWKNVQLSYND